MIQIQWTVSKRAPANRLRISEEISYMADPAAFLPDKEEQANSQKLLVQISMKIKKTKRMISKMYIGPYVA